MAKVDVTQLRRSGAETRPTASQPGRVADQGASPDRTSPDRAEFPDVSDDTLLARLRAGDGPAGEALVRRYAQPLLRYLQRLVGDEHAEELHQQTWLSVLDNLDKFDPGVVQGSASSAFKAWVFRIATNKANDLWRSRGRERAAKEGLRLVLDESAPRSSIGAEQAEATERLIRAIDRLPESQKQVLALRYYSNMKFVDIARLLGCPLNTALGRVHKAMIKLRQLLEETDERR